MFTRHRHVLGVVVLSEVASKSPCSFPMTSTTACYFANSRVSRRFSAHSRSPSLLGPEGPERRCGRGGAGTPWATASRATVYSRIWD